MSIEKQYVSFNDDFTDWQYASGVIIPKRRDLMVKNITVYCAYDYNANDAYFTNISLVLEPEESYSYDSKGNPIAATDDNAKTASEFFADFQHLKSYTTPAAGTKRHRLDTGIFQILQHSPRCGGYTGQRTNEGGFASCVPQRHTATAIFISAAIWTTNFPTAST